MDSQQVKQELGLPQKMRLKTVGKGVFVKKVLGARLLVRQVIPWTEADEFEKKSGLVLPSAAKAAATPIATYGPIVQVGDGCKYEWQVEDLVLFGKFSGMDFSMQNDDFRILHEEEILCVLDVDLETFAAVPVRE